MTRQTLRVLECDYPGCDATYTVDHKLDWFAVQARARAAKWRQDGNTHLCPRHAHRSPVQVRAMAGPRDSVR